MSNISIPTPYVIDRISRTSQLNGRVFKLTWFEKSGEFGGRGAYLKVVRATEGEVEFQLAHDGAVLSLVWPCSWPIQQKSAYGVTRDIELRLEEISDITDCAACFPACRLVPSVPVESAA